MMQDYMILRKDVRRVETGGGDRVIVISARGWKAGK